MSSTMTIEQICNWLVQRGVVARLVGDAGTVVSRVHTDTRTLQAGDLFVAIRGERFDANDMLAQAASAGAAAALAERSLVGSGLSGVEVPDSKRALGQLAAAWRAQFELPLIAVTGSNGKTTVTQMIASILRVENSDTAWATQGNLNNDIGVPLTLLGLKATHRLAVVELGMNHPGEIADLAGIARPTVAIINNAQREHLEFMHTVEAVARENGSVIEALPAQGVAVFPSDDAFAAVWRDLAGARRCITFALKAQADVTASSEWQGDHWLVRLATPLGAASARLHIAGRHNVKNALAATAACIAAGLSLSTIVAGLQAFEAVKGRSRASALTVQSRPVTLIDDTYNANPDSMRAAVDVLSELPAPHLLILGDMGEVGEQGPEFHAEIGEYAAQRGIETLWCTGELMRYGAAQFPRARHFASSQSLMEALPAEVTRYRSILVKGSRFMKMERVVSAITQTWPTTKESAHAA